jgi:hypothetical protein
VVADALFMDDSFEQWYYDWINCFVELYGGHRFKDKKYMRLLRRLRSGTLTNIDYDALDKRVTGCPYSGLQTCDIPDGTQIACHLNRDRSAMNSLVFAEHLKNTHSTFEFTPPPSHTQEAIYDGVIVGGIYLLLQDMICLTDAVIVMYRQHLGKNLEIHSLNCSIVYL